MQGDMRPSLEEVAHLYPIINDTLFSFVEKNNPGVQDWTRWWVVSNRYSHVLRLFRMKQPSKPYFDT